MLHSLSMVRSVRRVIDRGFRRTQQPREVVASAATVDGHPLPLSEPGAVVVLATPSPINWNERLPSGCTLSLFENSRALVVEGLSEARARHEMPRSAREQANQCLDLVSARSAASLRLAALDSCYL